MSQYRIAVVVGSLRRDSFNRIPAKTLYESIGFERRPYSTLTYRLSTQ